MDPIFSTWLQLVARWAHLVAGVIWIGFLFFFALVQLEAFRAMGPARLAAGNQIMPRAMWWFRWMAMLTFLSGMILLWLVYYAGEQLAYSMEEANTASTVVALLGGLAAVAAYDQITARVGQVWLAHSLSILLVALVYWLFYGVAQFGGRATWIHVGSLMGLALLVNVWVRVWPAVKHHIAPALEKGSPPPSQAMEILGTRARRSVYVAVPLLLLMISNHYPLLYESPSHGWYFAILMVAGWLVAVGALRKAGSWPDAPVKRDEGEIR